MKLTHQSPTTGSLQRLGRVPRSLRLAGAWRLDVAQPGWLAVEEGRVWLTRDGGGDDHVLAAGERLWLGRGACVVVDSWQPAAAARLGWQADVAAAGAAVPQRRGELRRRGGAAGASLGAAAAAVAWAGLARAFAALGAGLLAAARSAEARASRAQGCMAPGESMASSGALQ